MAGQFSLSEIAQLMHDEPRYQHRLKLLFEFFRGVGAPGTDLESLIRDEPPGVGDPRFDAVLAAAAEYVAYPSLDAKTLPWIKNIDLGPVKGLSRMGGVASLVTLAPAIFSDIQDGNGVKEAVVRESAAAATSIAASAMVGATIGSSFPVVGTILGAAAGAGVGYLTSKGIDWLW